MLPPDAQYLKSFNCSTVTVRGLTNATKARSIVAVGLPPEHHPFCQRSPTPYLFNLHTRSSFDNERDLFRHISRILAMEDGEQKDIIIDLGLSAIWFQDRLILLTKRPRDATDNNMSQVRQHNRKHGTHLYNGPLLLGLGNIGHKNISL